MSRAVDYGRPHSIGRRLRFLRGQETQKDFSARIGVTRSALANYETGRSVPSDGILEQIAARLSMPASYFSAPDMGPDDSPAAVYGNALEGRLGITDDEHAVLRVLRLASHDTARATLGALIEGIETDGAKGHLAELFLLPEDFARLQRMRENGGRFSRGSMELDADTRLRRVRELREKRAHGEVPQSVPQSSTD